jgi:hypothetical protein
LNETNRSFFNDGITRIRRENCKRGNGRRGHWLHLIACRTASASITFASGKGLAGTNARTAAKKVLAKGRNKRANISVSWSVGTTA